MLLKEFLKEHNAFLEEQKKVQKLEGALATVNERLKEQDAKIERDQRRDREKSYRAASSPSPLTVQRVLEALKFWGAHACSVLATPKAFASCELFWGLNLTC